MSSLSIIEDQIIAIANKYDRYRFVKNLLDLAKETEMDLRLEIAEDARKYGQVNAKNNAKFDAAIAGNKVKIELKTNYGFEKEDDKTPLNYDDMTKEERDCFEQKWTLNESKYKKLKEKYPNENLDIYKTVTEKPGAPVIEVTRL